MSYLLQALEILGSLGVFLFGMKIMSEALQKVAGKGLKGLLAKMTTNRVSGVGTGLVTTAVVQSSSATTVMVVSFVNARLLTLRQAIGVIMGANIGTTFTGWLVALIGFKVKVSALALPIIGIGMAMTFMKGSRRKQWGEVLLGFGLLFLGLHLLKASIPKLDDSQLSFLQGLGGHGFASMLAFVVIGTLITVVLQSSSATMTLTLTMTAAGWITFDNAAAMILGENIGTTVTALLASIGTSVTARRAAVAHTTFNVFGVIWALALMQWALLPLVDLVVPGDPRALATTHPDVVTAHLAMFHSGFNVVNALLLLPFVSTIARFVEWLVRDTEGDRGPVFSKLLSTPIVGTPEIQLVQLSAEMRRLVDLVSTMFRSAMKALTTQEADQDRLVASVLDDEVKVDMLEREITETLRRTSRESTSGQVARDIANMTQNAHRLERIGDHCERLASIAERVHRDQLPSVDAQALGNLAELQQLVEAALQNTRNYFDDGGSVEEARRIETEIDAARDRFRASYVESIQKDEHDRIPDLWFLDALNHVEEIGERCYAIAMQLRPPGTRRRDQLARATASSG